MVIDDKVLMKSATGRSCGIDDEVLLIGIDGYLFYITLALWFRKRFLCATTGLVCKRYRGRLWSKRRVYWRQRSISRAEYVQLARDRSLPHLPHRRYCGKDKCSLSQI